MRAFAVKQDVVRSHHAQRSLGCRRFPSPRRRGFGSGQVGMAFTETELETKVTMSRDSFVSLLQSYAKKKALPEGREMHGFICQHAFESDAQIGNLLINLYTNCSSIIDAYDVFDNMEAHDAYAWAMMISGCTLCGYTQDALALYKQMEIEGIQLDRVTCLAVLRACAAEGDVNQCKQVHTFIFTCGINLSANIGNSLIDMYAKCGDIDRAWQVFDTIPNQDAISWNIMIAAFARTGQIKEAFCFFNSMEKQNFDPDEVTFLSILKACSTHEQGKQIFTYILKNKNKLTIYVGNTLIDLFVKCNSLVNACEVFNEMKMHDTLTWTMLIAGCAKHSNKEEASCLFWRMGQECVLANTVTFVSVMSACSWLQQGKIFHTQNLASQLPPSLIVGNALIGMYFRCGSLQSARAVFDKMCEQDIITWNTVISGYATSEADKEALYLFCELLKKGFHLDAATYLSVFKACSSVGDLECCYVVHAHLLDGNVFIDICLESAMIDTYAKCWSIMDARHLFDKMAKYDAISWNTIVAACANCGENEDALNLFMQMELRGLNPDVASFLGVLRACTNAGFRNQGCVIHHYVVEASLEVHDFLCVTLIDFYAKSGNTEDACEIFEAMLACDVAAWNAIISGYAEHDQSEQALQFYERMKQERVSADAFTFVGVLKASSSLAASEKGLEIHDEAIKIGLDDLVYVGSALVDMHGKCGSPESAWLVFQRMHERDAVTWNALIASYALVGLCEETFKKYDLMLLDRADVDVVTFVHVLTACSHAGMLNHGYYCFGVCLKAGMISMLVDHYACMVDLLGRTGLLQEGLKFVEWMPIQPTPVVWTALLGACKFFGEAHLGLLMADYVLELDPNDSSTILQLSLLYYDYEHG